LGADWSANDRRTFRRERAVADKSEFVDIISEATRQVRRRVVRRVAEPEAKEGSRLGHRSSRLAQWKVQTFTPWKLRAWNWKDWD
jgi:hypothetical protein